MNRLAFWFLLGIVVLHTSRRLRILVSNSTTRHR
jgi:hypothetical protein